MDVHIALLGGFSVAARRGARTRRRLEPPRRRVPGEAARPCRRAPAAPRAGDRRAVAGPARRGGRAAAAQGRPLRPASARRRSPDAAAPAPGPGGAARRARGRRWTRSSSSGWAGRRSRRDRWPTPRRRWRCTAARCCPRTPTSPGPTDAARDAVRAARATCCAWPVAGNSWSGRTRSTRRPISRWPASTPSVATPERPCASSSGWTRPCAGSWARSRATPCEGSALS